MWFDCTKAALKKLKSAYNSLRRFMFLPWRNSATEMFANLGIHTFDEMFRIFFFRSRVTASHNQLIFGLCTAHCSVGLYAKLWAWWNSLLHNLYRMLFILGNCPMYAYFIYCVYVLLNCIVINYVLYIVLIWTKSLQ